MSELAGVLFLCVIMTIIAVLGYSNQLGECRDAVIGTPETLQVCPNTDHKLAYDADGFAWTCICKVDDND